MDAIKVLVVDDNKNHAEGLAELLNLSEFECTSAWGGADGLELAERLRVDGVLLDLDLPDMSGEDVCQQLRANLTTKSVAVLVIFHTGSQPTATVAKIADAFLTYPIGINEIFSVVQGCVARCRIRARAGQSVPSP